MNKSVVTPVAQNQTNQCVVTPKWFVDGSEYNVLPGTFKLLINGEKAFAEVYDAIAAAKKSVSIICWGFQPSMYFKRGDNGCGKRIGELLEEIATDKGDKKGVKVRILSWAMEADVVPGPFEGKASPTGVVPGEANTPGRRALSPKDWPATMNKSEYNYNQEWFMRYDKDQGLVYDKGVRTAAGLDGKPRTSNIEFVSRGFSTADREAILASERADPSTSKKTRSTQAGAASHHQKVVIVDFEDPERAVAFVMGHNMLDEYWDRSDHSYKRCEDPRRGRNGSRPRQDFSSRVRGAMLGDLFHNFNSAWKMEGGKDLIEGIAKPVFEKYPLSRITRDEEEEALRHELVKAKGEADREKAFQEANKFDFSPTGKKAIADSKSRQQAAEAREKELEKKISDLSSARASVVADGQEAIMGQILRTQPQYGKRDIAKGYLQAVGKATQYIYIENQYFRWALLAEKIKAAAQGQTENGRKPEIHGPLYLFVITNADKEGMGAGVKNTARMLDSLGRGDVLPEGVRQQNAEDTDAELARAKQQSAEEQSLQKGIASNTRTGNSKDLQSAKQRLEESKKRQAAADQRAEELKRQREAQLKEKEGVKESRSVISPKPVPGLKVHVCTLVAPDSPGRSGTNTTSAGKDQRALTREERIAQTEKDLDEANVNVVNLRTQRNQELLGGQPDGSPSRALPDLDRRLQAEEKKRDDLRRELNALKDGSNPIDWVDVYIHAKLMIIDDTFMTVGSANINSRSMETDSELNLIHANHLISQPARKELWQLHTKGRSGGEELGQMEKAYNAWDKLMDKNKTARNKKLQPVASLVEFFSATESRSDLD